MPRGCVSFSFLIRLIRLSHPRINQSAYKHTPLPRSGVGPLHPLLTLNPTQPVFTGAMTSKHSILMLWATNAYKHTPSPRRGVRPLHQSLAY